MPHNILVLDTGKEWGGGTNSLLELLERIDRTRYHFTALFYNNYKKGGESDIKSEIERLGIDFLLLEQKRQRAIAKTLKELFRVLFFFSRQLKKYMVFFIDYQFRIKGNAKEIAQLLNDLKIDLLYMNNQPSSNLEGIIAAHMADIPAIQHSRIGAELNTFEINAVNRYLEKMICVSRGVRESFVAQGIDPSRCEVVYNGIDTTLKPAKKQMEIRKMWGVASDDILIGTVGSLIKRKRIDDLIRILMELKLARSKRVKCMIVGDGPEREKLARKVERNGLRDDVIFTGFQTDAISYINAMDLFVMTSEKEGLPRVILEAMLLKKPCVAYNTIGPSELIMDKETGFLVPPGDIKRFSEKISSLIDSERMKKDMGRMGNRLILKDFSIDRYVTGVNNIFEEVLGRCTM